jgi:hypothetical protein
MLFKNRGAAARLAGMNTAGLDFQFFSSSILPTCR